jgi:hypothetical protein
LKKKLKNNDNKRRRKKMTNLKKIEEEFDKKFQPICNIWVNQGITENIKAFYRQAIKDLVLECVGGISSDLEYPYPTDHEIGYDHAKEEITNRINKMFEEK